MVVAESLGLVAVVAGLLGVSVRDLHTLVQDHRARRAKDGTERRRLDEKTLATPARRTDLVTRFYRKYQGDPSLSRFCFRVNNRQIETAILCRPDWLQINTPPLDVPTSLTSIGSVGANEIRAGDVEKKYAAKILERVERQGIKLWNAPLYRLVNARYGPSPKFEFCENEFLAWRFTTGLITDETDDALIETDGDVDRILANPDRHLPIRITRLPLSSSFRDLTSYFSAGGPGVVVAMARKSENDFIIPIQIRSQIVNDGRGLHAVVPIGFHQRMVDPVSEVNFYWTACRELYEELFGGEEVVADPSRMRHDWYFDSCPGLTYLREHEGAYRLEQLGFAFNGVAATYEVPMLMAMLDTWYWSRYSSDMKSIWETHRMIHLSTRNRAQIVKVLCENEWTAEGLFALVLALMRLKELDPSRVDLPEMNFSLVQ